MILPIYIYGQPVLRKVSQDIPTDYPDLDQLIEDMFQTLTESDGVGLAAPQLDIKKRIIALLVPSNNPEKPEPILDTVMYNPKIVSHSVQDACLADGEGCLSVDREVPGYVVRHARVTVTYTDMNGETQKIRLKNYPAIVVQHEIDHLNGVMFYDHINAKNPFSLDKDVLVLE